MKLRHLEVFHALMNARTMTEAAEYLNVTQPAVSMVLKHAEQYLGVRLFDRSGGRLTPTPEAIALIPEVDDIYDRIEAVSRSVQRMRDAATGVLTITATPSVNNDVLPAIIAAYSTRVPKARLVTRQVNTSVVFSEVLNRRAELGFATQPCVRTDLSLSTTIIARSKIYCIFAATHRLASLDAITPAVLVDEATIGPSPNSPLGAILQRMFGAGDLVYEPAVEVNSSLAAIPLAVSGVGVAIVENGAGIDHFTGIAARPLSPTVQTRTIAIQHREKRLSRLASIFMECAKQAGTPKRGRSAVRKLVG